MQDLRSSSSQAESVSLALVGGVGVQGSGLPEICYGSGNGNFAPRANSGAEDAQRRITRRHAGSARHDAKRDATVCYGRSLSTVSPVFCPRRWSRSCFWGLESSQRGLRRRSAPGALGRSLHGSGARPQKNQELTMPAKQRKSEELAAIPWSPPG